jgi:hypothetical protein
MDRSIAATIRRRSVDGQLSGVKDGSAAGDDDHLQIHELPDAEFGELATVRG